MLDELVRLCEREGRPATLLDGRVLVTAPLSWAGELNRMAMRNGITICGLGEVPLRLEDVFFHMTDCDPQSPTESPGAPELSRSVTA